MSVEKIITDWKKGYFKPVYWLEGEESFFIDQITQYAENHLLNSEEKGFNLNILYGKDVNIASLITLCKSFPMMGSKQVVIVKEAQNLKDIDKLSTYLDASQPSSILIIAYKDKKIDGRSSFGKKVKAQTVYFQANKLYDNQLPAWTEKLALSKGFSIEPQAVVLLVEHIGNDLSRINSEIEKLTISIKGNKNITADDIENYIGISKEYNIFEFQKALSVKNIGKCMQIIQYFSVNNKVAPLQLVLPTLYNFFSKLSIVTSLPSKREADIAKTIGINAYFAKDYTLATQYFSSKQIEKVLLLLHLYNLKSIGINNAHNSASDLLKELTIKICQ